MGDSKELKIAPLLKEAGSENRMGAMLNNAVKMGAKIKNIGSMCSQCACKFNSDANKEEHTVLKVYMMLESGGQFNCHPQEIGFGDAGIPCKGFLYIKQHMELAKCRERADDDEEFVKQRLNEQEAYVEKLMATPMEAKRKIEVLESARAQLNYFKDKLNNWI